MTMLQNSTATGSGEIRHFSCSACGKCCNHEPELELGETLNLYNRFILFGVFKEYLVPFRENSNKSEVWAQAQGNTLPTGFMIKLTRDHIKQFSSRECTDRGEQVTRHLIISSIPLQKNAGKCSALIDGKCSLYEHRPLACRSVPLHYAIPSFQLLKTFDRFVETDGYECMIGNDAPVLLRGTTVEDAEISATRSRAIVAGTHDKLWKKHILKEITSSKKTTKSIQSINDVSKNSRNGLVTIVSMFDIWRIALNNNIISNEIYRAICNSQVNLIELEMAGADTDQRARLLAMIDDYITP